MICELYDPMKLLININSSGSLLVPQNGRFNSLGTLIIRYLKLNVMIEE